MRRFISSLAQYVTRSSWTDCVLGRPLIPGEDTSHVRIAEVAGEVGDGVRVRSQDAGPGPDGRGGGERRVAG
jgi:hypothetical protein